MNTVNVYTLIEPENKEQILSKVTSIKDEYLNIIYQVSMHSGRKLILFGFQGNYAYVRDRMENMQIQSIDCKGGNRPIRLRLQG